MRRLVEGLDWRRSRDVEVVGTALSWVLNYLAALAQTWGADVEAPSMEEILRSFRGYRPEGNDGKG